MQIYLKKSVVSNTEYDYKTIATYVALRKIYSKEIQEYYVSINQLSYELYGCLNDNKHIREYLSAGIKKLIDTGLIKIVSTINKSEWIMDLSGLLIDRSKNEDDFYTIIDYDELHRIMNCSSDNGNINNMALLRCFINIIGTINMNQGIYIDELGDQKNDFVGYMPVDYLCTLSGITSNTLFTYNAILEKEKLLYIYRHNKDLRDSNGNIKSISNHYGRYCDAEYIEKFALQYENTLDIETLTKRQTKENKSLANKYHQMIEYGTRYDSDTENQIYNYVHKCNYELQAIIDSKNKQSSLSYGDMDYIEKCKARLRDESIFAKDNDPVLDNLSTTDDSVLSKTVSTEIDLVTSNTDFGDSDIWGEEDKIESPVIVEPKVNIVRMVSPSTREKKKTVQKPIEIVLEEKLSAYYQENKDFMNDSDIIFEFCLDNDIEDEKASKLLQRIKQWDLLEQKGFC